MRHPPIISLNLNHSIFPNAHQSCYVHRLLSISFCRICIVISIWITLTPPTIVAFLVTLPHSIIMFSHTKHLTRLSSLVLLRVTGMREDGDRGGSEEEETVGINKSDLC
jgi:hypothetical protein